MRLLLIEDNRDLARLVVNGLSAHDFAVDHCATLGGASAFVESARYDLILLDLGLPDGDGIDYVHALRRSGSSVPILILTARDGLDHRLIGLDSGADDYLIKPFAISELVARCRALLRRPGGSLGVNLVFGNLQLDTIRRSLTVGHRNVGASPREIALLETLLRNVGKVVARENLLGSLYSFGEDVTANALDAAVSRLRKKLDQSGATVTLTSVYGVGYALFCAPEQP